MKRPFLGRTLPVWVTSFVFLAVLLNAIPRSSSDVMWVHCEPDCDEVVEFRGWPLASISSSFEHAPPWETTYALGLGANLACAAGLAAAVALIASRIVRRRGAARGE